MGHASLRLGLLARKDSHQLTAHGLAVVSLRLMEASHVVHVTRPERLPELHHSLRGQRNEVVGKVLALVVIQLSLEDLSRLHLLNQGTVLVDIEVASLFDLAFIENHLDRNLTLVKPTKPVAR